MARRKKGRDLSGWVLIDKPAGITSTAVVNKVRFALDAKKAGHAGTLDPSATGLLVIAIGEATKAINCVTDSLKSYDFRIRLGQATNTDDADGEIIATSELRPADDEIIDALSHFVGDIEQVPPQFSAVHVDGERAYAKARAGEAMELAARPLYVDELTLIDRTGPDEADLNLVCGKGGYVRSIARDLGAALGCHAHVVTLRRLWSGPFDVSDALSMEEVERLARSPDLDRHLRPLEHGLQDLPFVGVSALAVPRLQNGNPVEVATSDLTYGDSCWARHNDRALALGTFKGGMFHPKRVIVDHDV